MPTIAIREPAAPMRPPRAAGTPPSDSRAMSGRVFTVGLLLFFAIFLGGLVLLISTRSWRQSERLVAAGLRSPAGVVLLPDDALVVVEAGLPDRAARRAGAIVPTSSGRLTWSRPDSSSRGTLLENLPSQYDGRTDTVSGPAGIARGADGRLLIAIGACSQPRCGTVQAMDADGRLSQIADVTGFLRQQPATATRPSSPRGLAVAPDGAVYVADAGAASVVRIDLVGGDDARSAMRLVAHFAADAVPTGIAIGPDGALAVALARPTTDGAGGGSVVRIDASGAVTTITAGLTVPTGLAVQPDGQVLVLEGAASTGPAAGADAAPGAGARAGTGAHGGRLLRIDPARPTEWTVVSADLDAPTGLVLAADGRVYVTMRGPSGDAGGASGELRQIRRLGPQPKPRIV